MKTDDLMRAISVIWLLLIMFRLVLYSTPYSNTPGGETFSLVLNIILIGGIILLAAIFFRRFMNFAGAKANKSAHCPQCYAKIDPELDFCPQCGNDLRPR